jgi:hypothetical protein
MLVKRIGHTLCYVPAIFKYLHLYYLALPWQTMKDISTPSEAGPMIKPEPNSVNVITYKQTNGKKSNPSIKQGLEQVIQNAAIFIGVIYNPESISLYAFFGTDSKNQNVITCEKFDLVGS